MSDMAHAFIKGFEAAGCIAEHQRFCRWHVREAWERNLTKFKNCDQAYKKEQLTRRLIRIQELPDKEDFHSQLDKLLKEYNEGDTKGVTENFGLYFKKTYVQVNKPETWAYCYTEGGGPLNNMGVENYHKQLKYLYLERKRAPIWILLDRTIPQIIRRNASILGGKIQAQSTLKKV